MTVVAALELYGRRLEAAAPCRVRYCDGTLHELPLGRWLADPSSEEQAVLARAQAPVLDIGCGPGRHTAALTRWGIQTVGLDVSPSAVRLARRRGARVIEASVFEAVPQEGWWGSALLLDGNIGIGGDPVALLARVRDLLRAGGQVLVEVERGRGGGPGRARLEMPGATSRWFRWARVNGEEIKIAAEAAGLAPHDAWTQGGRRFVELRSP